MEREDEFRPETPIWVVWGPTAEWGDGSGPLSAYFDEDGAKSDILSREAGDKEYIADVRREAGPLCDKCGKDEHDGSEDHAFGQFDGGWPLNLGRGYWVVQETLATVIGSNDEEEFMIWMEDRTSAGGPYFLNDEWVRDAVFEGIQP